MNRKVLNVTLQFMQIVFKKTDFKNFKQNLTKQNCTKMNFSVYNEFYLYQYES